MITEPTIVEREASPYLAVRRSVTIPFGEAIDEAMGTLFSSLNERDIEPAGPVFFKYNLVDMPNLEIDFGVPVAEGIDGGGTLVSGTLPAGRYAELIHFGHYDHLMEANKALIDWARENDVEWDVRETPHGELFASRLELYLNSPDEEPDPDKWETIVSIKVRD